MLVNKRSRKKMFYRSGVDKGHNTKGFVAAVIYYHYKDPNNPKKTLMDIASVMLLTLNVSSKMCSTNGLK